MKKILIGALILVLAVVLLPSNQSVSAKDDMEKYYKIFDKLYEKDYYENQGVLVIDTINDGNEKIVLDGVEYDKKVFYSTLYDQNKIGKVKEKIKENKEKDEYKDYQGLDDIEHILDLYNSEELSFKQVIDFIDDKDYIKENKKFFKDLIPKDFVEDDRNIVPLTNYSYETITTGYYEDFDADNTYYGIYHKQAEYYLESSVKIYTGNIRYVMAYPLNTYTENEHKSSIEFIYNPDGSSTTRPEAKWTLIIDYLGYQKIIITDLDDGVPGDESPYKMTQEMHYDRNKYNCVNYEDSISCFQEEEIMYCISSFGGLVSGACEMVTDLSESELTNLGFTNGHSNYFHELLVTDGYSRDKYKKSIYYYDLQVQKYTYGSLEAIMIDKGNNVFEHDTSSLRMGTFNFGVPESEEYGSEAHYFRDVYTYLIWGNNYEDYISHTPYERFIWDKGSRYGIASFKSREGDTLIDYYETYYSSWIGGDDIPNEVINSNLYLDFIAPTVYQISYYITEDTYSDIDWGVYVTPYDNYTNSEDIEVVEIYDNVNYALPGLYFVKIELRDLVGNTREKTLKIYVQEVSSC